MDVNGVKQPNKNHCSPTWKIRPWWDSYSNPNHDSTGAAIRSLQFIQTVILRYFEVTIDACARSPRGPRVLCFRMMRLRCATHRSPIGWHRMDSLKSISQPLGFITSINAYSRVNNTQNKHFNDKYKKNINLFSCNPSAPPWTWRPSPSA